MDTVLLILGIICLLTGIIGCILPFLPGPPLAYGSLLLLQFSKWSDYTPEFLIIWAAITILVVLADYYIPVWGTKRFGGTKGGTWGATIGLLVGILFMPPVGMILGPFIGAFLGELINGQDSGKAIRSAIGSFIGFITGTIMKLGVCIMMGYYFFKAVL
jgi:uncharacterized protein